MKSKLFVFAIVATVAIAYFLPNLANGIPLNTITDIGIGFIFFFYGLKLSFDDLRTGLGNYKLHMLIQFSTFLLFPLLVLLVYPLFDHENNHQLWLAFFFLAVLPSTVSSSVVMVSIAKGNIPAAIFNAGLSGIIGVLATPFWLSFFLPAQQLDFTAVVYKLLYQIVAPLIIGFLLQRFFNAFMNKYGSKISLFDKSIILLIVYESFSKSFKSGLFSGIKLYDYLFIYFGVLALFFLVYYAMGWFAKLFSFSEEDIITTKFCGSKKSLVHGSAMVKVIFGNVAGAGLFLLPLMLYHFSQLVIVAFFAEKYAEEKELDS